MDKFKSMFASKINWTQVVGFVAMMLALFGFELSADDQVKIVTAIAAGSQAVTIVWRIFFTSKVLTVSGDPPA